MGKQETAERQFAQALVKELHEQHTRLHGKEMGIIPVQLVFAAKHTLEELLRQIIVLETEAALRADAAPQPQASPQAARCDLPRCLDGYGECEKVGPHCQQPQASPQASAEDLRRMVGYMFECEDAEAKAAWQRIRADYERVGVGRE